MQLCNLPNNLINTYPKFFLNNYFRVLIFLVVSISMSSIIINTITYEQFSTSGIYILVSITLYMIAEYIRMKTSLSKITQPLKIWHKTCKAKIPDEHIYSVICQKSLMSIFDNTNQRTVKEFIFRIKNFILNLF